MTEPKVPVGEDTRTLYLIDISSFIFRAFYAIRSLTNSKGEPTNAVYGVAQMVAQLLDERHAGYMAIVYDSKTPSFRKEMYAEYKANRSAAPEELVPQFDRIESLISSMELPSFRQDGIEADDLIATLAQKWEAASKYHRVVIVSGDKDLMQLVSDRVGILDTLQKKTYGPKEVEEKFGIPPSQIRDYLALVGDSSDNIPGVPSIGPKSAVDLLKAHGSLDEILAAAADGKISGKKGEVLKSHAEDARLSARLASLKTDLSVDSSPENLHYRFHLTSACMALLQELELHSLAKKWESRWGTSPEAVHPGTAQDAEASDSAESAPISEIASSPQAALTQAVTPQPRFITVDNEDALQALAEKVRARGCFGFDIESTSLNPRQAEFVGFAISVGSDEGYYIPVGHRGTHAPQLPLETVLGVLKPLLEDPKIGKVGQNLKYDWSVLYSHGVKPAGILADTMVADYVLEPEGRHNLETLALTHLGHTVTTYEQVCGKGKDQIGFDQVPIDQATHYSAEDAWAAWRVWETLSPRLSEEGVQGIYEQVDLPLVDILCRMELEGIAIDVPYLQELSRDLDHDLKRIEKDIARFTVGPVNLNSPKQLAHLLFDELKLPTGAKTKTGYSTDASVLEGLADLHEVPRLLLEYRELSKLKGTYVDPLPGMRDPKSGRVHASFHQAVAATGRLSSSDPNLQNIPIRSERGRKIRRAFIPREGQLLVSADYSQIELRLLAHMSQDPELVGSFLREEDVHRRTASEIFGVSPDQVDDRQRSIAKAINFGLMYGKTAHGLAQELKISRKEAQETIDRYFHRYSGVKKFLDGQIQQARDSGQVHTLAGRRRKLRDIHSRNPALRAVAERMAMNTPIQGTAADLIKLAMIDLDRALTSQKLRARLILQVHDELVLDVPKGEQSVVEKILAETMEGAMKLTVPLRVNVSSGATWADL
jgi:DNA polymerase-1